MPNVERIKRRLKRRKPLFFLNVKRKLAHIFVLVYTKNNDLVTFFMRIECIRGHFAALIETKWNEQNVRFVIIERRQKRNEKRSEKRRFLRPRSHLWSEHACWCRAHEHAISGTTARGHVL